MMDKAQRNERLLTWKGGGWILMLAAIPVVVLLMWAIAGAVSRGFQGRRFVHDIEAFQFSLEPASIPVERLDVGAGARDFIKPLNDPPMILGADVLSVNEAQRGKYLVSGDRVIGIEIGGEARAYPVRMLGWHEVVNDSIRGVPIGVTYNGLCDSVVVFDRRVSERTLRLRSSGLVFNSNHLLYEDSSEAPGGEGLWLQLQARAVTGPESAKGERLRVLPATLTTWRRWLEMHPDTRVLAPRPDPDMVKYYDRRTYGDYFSSDQLRFIVEPLPNDDRPLKTPTISLRITHDDANSDPQAWKTFSIPALIADADASGRVTRKLDNLTLTFETTAQPPTAWVVGSDRYPTVYAFWFAWYAMHPDATLIE